MLNDNIKCSNQNNCHIKFYSYGYFFKIKYYDLKCYNKSHWKLNKNMRYPMYTTNLECYDKYKIYKEFFNRVLLDIMTY